MHGKSEVLAPGVFPDQKELRRGLSSAEVHVGCPGARRSWCSHASGSGVASAALRSALATPVHAGAGVHTISCPVQVQVSSGAQTNTASTSVHSKGCLGTPGARRSPASLGEGAEIHVEAPCSARCDLGLEADDGRSSGVRCALLCPPPPRLPWHPLTGGLTGTASQVVSAGMVLREWPHRAGLAGSLGLAGGGEQRPPQSPS